MVIVFGLFVYWCLQRHEYMLCIGLLHDWLIGLWFLQSHQLLGALVHRFICVFKTIGFLVFWFLGFFNVLSFLVDLFLHFLGFLFVVISSRSSASWFLGFFKVLGNCELRSIRTNHIHGHSV